MRSQTSSHPFISFTLFIFFFFHFPSLFHSFVLCMLALLLLMLMLLLGNVKTKDNDPNQVQHDQCSVRVRHGHHSVYQNSSGPTSINDSYPTFYFHWKRIFK